MLTAGASNNGINISTGSREPSQQKGPLDPALERLKKLSFRRLHKVCLLGSHRWIFLLFGWFNESFGSKMLTLTRQYQLVKARTWQQISFLKISNDYALYPRSFKCPFTPPEKGAVEHVLLGESFRNSLYKSSSK